MKKKQVFRVFTIRRRLLDFAAMALLVASLAPLPRPVTAQEADTVVTMWFAIFNNPDACTGGGPGVCTAADLRNPAAQASLLYATGQRVRSPERVSFAAALGKASTIGVESGYGLLDLTKAEIHLVLRTHGPMLAGLLDQQATTFNGGCPPNSCGNLQFAVHRPAEADPEGRSISVVQRWSDRSVVSGASSTVWRRNDGIIAVFNTDLR